jgi:hypothetical protein
MTFVTYSEFNRDLERQQVSTKRQMRQLEAEERRLLKNPSLLKVVFSPVNLACWMLLFATVGLLIYLHYASRMVAWSRTNVEPRVPFVFLASSVDNDDGASSLLTGNSSVHSDFDNISSSFNISKVFYNSSLLPD